MLFGFFLTGLLGTYLTYIYSYRLKQVEFELSDKQKDREREKDERQKQLEYQRNQFDKQRDQERDERLNNLEHLRNKNQIELEYQRSVDQREIARNRSFSDELNKVRATKIAEVWEQIYLYENELGSAEGKLDEELQKIVDENNIEVKKLISQLKVSDKRVVIQSPPTQNQPTSSGNRLGRIFDITRYKADRQQLPKILGERFREIFKTSDDLFVIVNRTALKNRFWLGEEHYSSIHSYILASQKYVQVSKSYLDTQDTARKEELALEVQKAMIERDRWRKTIINIRDSLLKD